MSIGNFRPDKMFIIVQLLLFFIFLFNRQGLFAQQKTLTVETASTLSAGAEYSQFEQKRQKLLGNAKASKYNGEIFTEVSKSLQYYMLHITTYEGSILKWKCFEFWLLSYSARPNRSGRTKPFSFHSKYFY